MTKNTEFKIDQLKSLKRGLEEMKDELCAAVEKDLGRGAFYTYTAEICLCIANVQDAIDNIRSWIQPTVVDTPLSLAPGRSYIMPEPLGVIAVLGSWNYPISICVGPLTGVISAGNCCLIKPSEIAPNCSRAITKLC